MAYYRCSIINPAGKKTTLIKEAAGKQELVASFNNTEHILVKYVQVSDSSIIQSKKNYNRDIVLEFTEIMTSLIKSGLTIQDSISLCCSITTNPKTTWLCKSLLRALQNGLPLHEALKMHSPSFPPLYQSLVRLGEQTGSVAAVFQRMGVYLRNEKKIRGKIGNVLWYPALVLFIALAGGVGIIAFILPRMAEIFSAFNTGTDQSAVMELTRVYRSIWVSVAVIIVIAAAITGSILLRKYSARFAYLSDYLFLNMPLFGSFIKAIQTMDFSFAMEMLSGSGINVHTALKETAGVIRNRAYGKALIEVHSMLLKGEQLSMAFGLFKEFPPYIATWIAVGERTGTVEPVFTQIRAYFQEDVDRISERLMNLLEPCLILAVGIIVLTMILQFILPLFSLYGRLL
ncbi:MAG: type II secretion system F family protein [Treponema sp.]|jgi:type II secretory pathway component PulF|nr:type II secretion system F family protein [Treponema sp.]